jgi:hypothetical protein
MLLTSLTKANDYSFGIEEYKGRLRFVIFYKEEEIDCRKEDRKVINSFIRSSDVGIFQGRIKLRSELDYIIVFLKGECLGTIAKTEFDRVLAKIGLK